MGKFQIYQDGRAAGTNPISGSDFVTKDYLESHSGVELDPVYKADSGSLKASASLASASNTWITLNSGSLAISMSYDSDQKKIKLFSSGSTVVAEIDATDFIKDGMVNTITLDTSSLDLTITFNTDAGKEDIVVPMRNVFDLTMFYTKDETYSRDEITTLLQPFVSTSNWVTENSSSVESTVDWVTANSASITGSGGGGGIGTETDPVYKIDSASLKASASLAQGIASITASLIASASVAKTASSSAAAISAKTGSYDALQGLPAVTAADNGKVLMVVGGAWTLVQAVSIYTGSAAPDNSQGNDGDIYLQS